MEIRQAKSDKEGYWLNHDSTGVRLHRGSCDYPKMFFAHLYPDKWAWFNTKEEAIASTGRQVRPCGACNP